MNCRFNFVRTAGLMAGLAAVLAAAGCEPQVVTVTVKHIEGAATEGAAAGAAVTEFGNLNGTILCEGTPPPAANLVEKNDAGARDASVCAAETVPDESLLVNPANKGVANVVIYLAKTPGTIKPDLLAIPTEPVIFDQKGCRFHPHVIKLRVNQTLLVKSDDPIAHNTHTYPGRSKSFNGAINANDRGGVKIQYDKTEAQPVEVKCDLHTWMKAYHVPLDHPYVAITDADGKFSIPGLPVGKHQFKVWHEKRGFLETKLQIEIKANADVTHDLSYGADKLAAVTQPSREEPSRMVTYQRLLRGGSLALTTEN